MNKNFSPELSIPAQHAPASDSFDIRPQATKRWIAGLPMANTRETSRLVYGALREINRLELEPQTRFTALESFRTPTQHIGDILKKHFVGQPFPLPKKNQKVAEFARELQAEMALGYKIIVKELIETAASRGGGKLSSELKTLLTLSAHRAMHYLGRVLLHTYFVYAECPTNLWKEIHQLYLCAEAHKLDTKTVKDQEGRLVQESSIGAIHKQILLLALAGPYRMRQGEVDQIDIVLEAWAPHTRLLPATDPERKQALFAVLLDGDDQPRYFEQDQTDSGQYRRILDTVGLARVVRSHITPSSDDTEGKPEKKPSAPPVPLSQDILKRLMLAWGVMSKRSFSRAQTASKVFVASGLSAVHHYISGKGPFAPGHHNTGHMGERQQGTRAQFSSRAVRTETESQPDVWEFIYPGGRKAEKEGNATTHPAPLRPDAGGQFPTYVWNMLNESAGGVCLLWEDESPSKAQVGELICLQQLEPGDAPGHWEIGVIRWMKHATGKGLELGVQMLAPGARAIATKICKEDGRCGEYLRSLLLPELPALQQPETIITPAFPYRLGSPVIINDNGTERRVELVKMLEGTGLFAQFQFAEHDLSSQEKADKPADRPDDFDSVWSYI